MSDPRSTSPFFDLHPGLGSRIARAKTADNRPGLGHLLDWARPARRDELRVAVRRPDDLLVFDLVFANLTLQSGSDDGPPRLDRTSASAPALMIVEFPPQSFGEEAFLAISNQSADENKEISSDPAYPDKNVADAVPSEPTPPPPSARIRMAGPSRLAYTMPAGQQSLLFTLDAVLEAMRSWPLRRDPIARPDLTLTLAAAAASELVSSIETLTVIDGSDDAANSQILIPPDATQAAALARFADPDELGSVRASLQSGLEARGLDGISRRLDVATTHLLERSIDELVATEACGGVLGQALDQELASLSETYRALARDRNARDAARAALALGIAQGLAIAAQQGDFGFDHSILDRLPLLPQLLTPHVPSLDVTALEVPYRLLTSPIGPARFTHGIAPVRAPVSQRTELWHTRLTTKPANFGAASGSRVRAIWSPDYPETDAALISLLGSSTPPPGPQPFRMPLDPLDRKMIVRLTAGFGEERPNTLPYHPRSALAERLHLSALGALFDAEGAWDTRPTGVDLEQWRHRSTLGRDHYVRVVYAGYLCPFGHACSLVKVTERQFETSPHVLGGKRVAVLRQRFFLVVREPSIRYQPNQHQHKSRNFPFSQVDILTRVTPDLSEPGVGASRVAQDDIYTDQSIAPRQLFWPTLAGGTDFRFEVVGIDLDGQRVSLSVPLLFVGDTVNQNNGKVAASRAAFNLDTVLRRNAAVGGAPVTLAPSAANNNDESGETRFPTDHLVLAAGNTAGPHDVEAPNFFPEVASARVGIPALQKLLSRPDAQFDVHYADVFVAHGFGELDPSKNKGNVFLRLDTPYAVGFGGGSDGSTDAVGGLAAPQMAVHAISRAMGPVSVSAAKAAIPQDLEDALDQVAGGNFNPADFFDGANILGGVDLGDIVQVATTLLGLDVPKLLSRELPDRVEASFAWDTNVTQSDPLNLLIPEADQQNPTRLLMNSLITTPISAPQDSHYSATASLSNFKVNLFGMVVIWFESISFNAQKGQKPDVMVDLRQGDDSVQFGGPLEFVNELRNLIPSNGFSDPPAISVTPSGLEASYSLTLPTVGVGIFTLSNLSLGAGFSLPFDSSPAAVKFNFAQREQPFNLSVSLFGGGGFFAIGLSTRGVNEIEAALEFGAAIAIDIGVASGGVEVKAGVYFHWLEPVPDQGSIELTGYVRLHGELSVLGLISASLTFNLQLSYLKDQAANESVVWGEATLVIEVEVLFFSASVEASCRREFAGSESDPKFIDQIPTEDVWGIYCNAFAEEAA